MLEDLGFFLGRFDIFFFWGWDFGAGRTISVPGEPWAHIQMGWEGVFLLEHGIFHSFLSFLACFDEIACGVD